MRGQFRGYRKEQGVAPDSQVETFAAVQSGDRLLALERRAVLHPRGQMPAGDLHRGGRRAAPAAVRSYRRPPPPPNYFRFRISPDVAIALGTMVMNPGEAMAGAPVELLACQRPDVGEVDAYERLLGDAMRGDPTLFAREDYVEEAWRIVEPVLGNVTPLYEYDRKTWGPKEMEETIAPPLGWVDPTGTC